MRVTIVFLAVVAHITASEVHEGVSLTASSPVTYEASYNHQPVVVVKKTTYYEPELVAVVVEKGVDDIPEEAVLIQNYADVLGSSNHEIRLCAADNNKCLDTPVTKVLVPTLFQSIGQNGFKKFFEHAKDVPWISTLDDNVELVKPVLSPKTSGLTKIFHEAPSVISLDSYKPFEVVPSDIFKYTSETPVIPQYRTVLPPLAASTPVVSSTEVTQTLPTPYDVTRTSYISPSNVASQSLSAVLPSNIQAAFAPLDQISTAGSLLGGVTTRSAYQPSPAPLDQISTGGSLLGGVTAAFQPYPTYYNQFLRHRRAILPKIYY